MYCTRINVCIKIILDIHADLHYNWQFLYSKHAVLILTTTKRKWFFTQYIMFFYFICLDKSKIQNYVRHFWRAGRMPYNRTQFIHIHLRVEYVIILLWIIANVKRTQQIILQNFLIKWITGLKKMNQFNFS